MKTGIAKELPWYVRIPLKLAFFLATSPEDVGERLFYVGYSSPFYSKGAHLLDSSVADVSKKPIQKGYLTEPLQEKIWKHTEAIYKKALNSGE